jgi:hypothetical protein
VVRGPSIGIFSVDEASFQFLGEETGDEAGAAAARIDSEGDGSLRMAVGAPGARTESAATGVVYMVDFEEAGLFNLSVAEVRLHGSFTGERAGASIDQAGDVNGDGHPDLLIGAPHRSPGPGLGSAGGAYLVYGPFESGALAERSVRIDGSVGGTKVGHSVAGVGDTDGDERDDFVLGCLDCNAAYVFTDAPDATIGLDSASAVWAGENANDYAGWSVASAGDVNRDGLADILVGAKGNDFGHANAGAAYLLYGPFSGEQVLDTANAKFYGAQNNEQAGTLVLGGGDIDGDGFLEILVGSPLTDSPYEDAGRVSLFFGDARL